MCKLVHLSVLPDVAKTIYYTRTKNSIEKTIHNCSHLHRSHLSWNDSTWHQTGDLTGKWWKTWETEIAFFQSKQCFFFIEPNSSMLYLPHNLAKLKHGRILFPPFFSNQDSKNSIFLTFKVVIRERVTVYPFK